MPIEEKKGSKFGEGQTTLIAFNVKNQQDEVHIVTLDKNGDYVFTAEDGTFFKLSGELSKEDLESKLSEHKEVNTGRITAEEVEKKEKERLERIAELASEQASK